MRTRRFVAIAAAALLPILLSAGAPSAFAQPRALPEVSGLRISITGDCPPGTVLKAKPKARAEYRRAHRIASRWHVSKRGHRGLVLCAPAAAASPAASPPASPMPSASPAADASVAAAWRMDMLARINAVRAGVGSGPLTLCAPIERAAQSYAETMARTQRFSHVGEDGSQAWERMTAQGYRWSTAGENIAKGHPDVNAVMAGWIASPGHYRNLVNPDFRHVGLGLAPDAAGANWWVQDFGAGGRC